MTVKSRPRIHGGSSGEHKLGNFGVALTEGEESNTLIFCGVGWRTVCLK